MRIRWFLLFSMLCLFGSPPAEAECNEVVSVTFVNDVGWEDVYVYTWTTVGDQTTEFSGTWPGTKLEPTGGTYRYQCDASSAPAYIIFNNGYSGDGNQTADLVFQNGKSYSYMGDHEFANGEYLLRNVSSDRYLGAGNDWGTRASLLEHPEYVRLIAAPNGKYYIESQYSDGDGKIYFSGNYMDSPDKATLTIAKTERILSTVGGQSTHAHTIANGEIYYGYDGASTILGKLTSSTGENALWEIVSVGEAKAALSQATVDSPSDATFLIADANFGRNNRDYGQWTFEASNQNNSGDVTNFCVESWHATFAMSQTLTGVPNGVYALSAQGFYAQDGSDTEHLPVFFANEETVIFPLKAGNENSMETASHSFSSGLYAIDPIFVRVTDGTLTIGARLDVNTSLWCIWDNFTLMYYGIDADIAQMKFDRRFASCVQEITTLQSTIGLTTQAKQLLTAAMMEYGGIDKSTSEAGQVRVLQQMESAIAYAQEGLKLVESLKAAYTKYQQYFRSEGSADASLMALLADIKSAIDGEQYESNEQLASWIEEINTAKTTYNPYEYSYWFDDAKDGAVIEISSQPTQSLLADVSGLSETIHALHIQVQGNGTQILGVDDGVVNTAQQVMHSIPLTRYFVKTPVNATLTGRYWFDDEVDKIYTSDRTQGAFDIDVSQLSEGFHSIHYQIMGINNCISQTATHSFYKVYMPAQSSWRCWFDNDYASVQSGSDMGETLLLDVSQLSDGYHVMHLQVDGGAQSQSTPITKHFVKIPQTIGVDHFTCLCMVNDKLLHKENVSAGNGIIEWNFDVSQLPQGFHRLFIQIVTPSGAASNTYESFFLRETTHAEFADMKCVYAIDGAEFNTEAGTLADGTYHFDLDVAALDNGLHRIAYMLNNGKGVTTKAQTQFFTKIPVGGNGITEYWYWLNDNDGNPNKVTLPTRQDPFSLISLLPVESQPLRSSLFQFRVENGQPVIYAKNDFHIRFYDASGRFTDVTKQYVDEQVSQEVEPVGELQSTQTFDKVAENDIRWYTMQVAPGDTAAFRVSQAATVQVFAPSGEEVFKTSESASVNWSGIHTWEDGTYYVAVHDVTGSRNTMTLDYMHMDKYDVVDWDVHTVGNGGCSTITFKGNGFRDLYAVDLVIAPGDTIHSVDIGHESDAETSVTFDFTGADLGKYDAVFHFTQEDKPFANIVTVEEAVDIELATNVSFPSTFLRGTSTTYTIKITNMGNMTAYYVPLELRLKVNSIKNISAIHFDGYITPAKLSDVLLSDSLEEETINIIREVENEVSDLSQFVIYSDTLSNVDYGLSQIILSIPPNSTKTFTVAIKSSSTVSLEARMTDEWFPLTEYKTSANSRRRVLKATKRDWMCCQRERFECAADALASIAGVFMPPGAGCATSLTLTGLETAYDVWCSDGGSASERWNNYLKSQGQSLANRLIQSAISCVTAYFHLQKKKLMEDRQLAAQLGSSTEVSRINSEIEALRTMERSVIRNIYNGICTSILGADCVKAFTETKPNCPPCTSGCGGGGSSSPVPPADPNDIYGYLSDAGSKFISDHVEKVNYTIEFENDTTFAEASAHTIVIKDTLDSRYFDLKSFLPTTIKLGSRETFLTEADVMTQSGVTSFLKTIDMRPEINAIAQVEGTYSQNTGIAEWQFTSLDPMTMEPTDDLMQGILPVNYDGTSGIGEVMYEIGVKPNKADGTEIPNRASIVFDYEEAILTPTWTNIVDATAPESYVTDVQMATDSTAAVRIAATDELSGPWRYNVYVQYGSGAWFLGAENVPIDSVARVKVYEGIDHGFYTLVTDSAGNVEQKEAAREFSFEVFGPQEDTNTKIELAQGWNWISHNQQDALTTEALKAKAQRIVSQTDELFKDSRFGWTGDLDELLPTELYKVQMAEADEVQLSGKLFNAAFRSVPLYEGWNWMGYPVARTMTPAEALQKMEAEEGDFIMGQDGMATFSEGQWTGTLLEMQPGQGYMYRSVGDKNLFLNATAQSSSRRANVQRVTANVQYPDGWTMDKRKYPNVMGLVADLYQDGELLDAEEWLVAAFCGDYQSPEAECRGLSQTVNGHLMMNVYGTGGERITFMALNLESGEVVAVEESEPFRTDILGTMQQPYELHSGVTTGIYDLQFTDLRFDGSAAYDLQGRQIVNSKSVNRKYAKGVYIVTDEKNKRTQKVVTK